MEAEWVGSRVTVSDWMQDLGAAATHRGDAEADGIDDLDPRL